MAYTKMSSLIATIIAHVAKKQDSFFDTVELDRRKDTELICNTLKENIWERWDGWWDGFSV